MNTKFRSITIAVLVLLAGVALNGCSDNNNDVNRCLPFFGFGHPLASDTSVDNAVNFSAASIDAAEGDGEFTIMPVEEPIILPIEDGAGGGEDGGDGGLGDIIESGWDRNSHDGD